MDEHDSKQSTADTTFFIQLLLHQMQSSFQTILDSIVSKINEKGNRIDELEGKHGGDPPGLAEHTVMMTRHHRSVGEHGGERGDGVTEIEIEERERGKQLGQNVDFKVDWVDRVDRVEKNSKILVD